MTPKIIYCFFYFEFNIWHIILPKHTAKKSIPVEQIQITGETK